jgi:1-acyl-sn-glycerol-3-phosphate acyltransferase
MARTPGLSGRPPRASSLVLPLQLAETFRICTPTVVEAALGRLTRESCDARLAVWSRRAMTLAEAELDVDGLEHVSADRSVLLMSNHQSAYDIFSLFVAFPHSMRMIAKKEMFRLPIMGGGMRAAEFIELDRSDRAKAFAALERAKDKIASGINVWIAPEGTRSDDGKLLPFKKGGFVMAQQTGVPIQPVTIDGTREILPAKEFRVRKGKRVRITFHEPIPVNGRDRDSLVDQVRDRIGSVLSTA